MLKTALIKEYIYANLNRRNPAVIFLLYVYRKARRIYIRVAEKILLFEKLIKVRYGHRLYKNHINNKANTLLLLNENPLGNKRSVKILKILSDNAGPNRKVAVIVSNAEAAIAMKKLKDDKIIVVNLQDFWLSSDVDNLNHGIANEFLNNIENSLTDMAKRDEVVEDSFLLLQSLTMSMHDELVSYLRLLNALSFAIKSEANIVYICPQINIAKQIAIHQFFTNSFKHNSVVLCVDIFSKWITCKKSPVAKSIFRKPSYLEKKNYSPDRVTPPRKQEPKPKENSTGIVLVTDAAPESHFWSAVSNISKELNDSRTPHSIITSRVPSADALRSSRANASHILNLRGDHNNQEYSDMCNAALQVYGYILAQKANSQTQDDLRHFIWNWLCLTITDGDLTKTLFEYINRLKTILVRDQTVGLIVLPHWGLLAWTAIKVAKYRGIQVLSAPAVTVVSSSASIVGWEDIDLIGCYGMQCFESFVSVGVAREKLRLIGNISLDHLSKIKRNDAISRLSLPSSNLKGIILLFATSGINFNEREMLASLIDFCNSDSNISLIVRPHPSLGVAAYSYVCELNRGGSVFVNNYGSSDDAICAADIVITDYSTIGADAISLGKSIIVINSTGKNFPANDYHQYGVAALVTEPNQIARKVTELLDIKQCNDTIQRRREFLNAYNWKCDFQASLRLINHLKIN